MRRFGLLVVVAAMCLLVAGVKAQGKEDAALQALVERFTTAQATMDAKTLAEVTEADYIEVSPLGEVDEREKMLGFYAPQNNFPQAKSKLEEFKIRSY